MTNFLVLTLICSVFFPPVAVSSYLLFLSDYLILAQVAWLGAGCLRNKERINPLLVALIFWMIASYFQVFRGVDFTSQLNAAFSENGLGGFVVSEDQARSWQREVVLLVRFVSWILFCKFVVSYLRQKRLHSAIFIRPALGLLAALLALFSLEKVFPVFHATVGDFYKHGAPALWEGRVYGPFQSPLEAGVFMYGAALLAYMQAEKKSILLVVTAFALTFFFTKTATPVAALLLAIACVQAFSLKGKKRWILPVLVILCVPAFYFLSKHNIEFQVKMANIMWRFKLWSVYLGAIAQDPIALIFGIGFSTAHADNSYLLILMKTGLVGFSLFLIWLFNWISKNKVHLDKNSQILVLWILIMGVSLDVFIFRHFVILLALLMVPFLSREIECRQK